MKTPYFLLLGLALTFAACNDNKDTSAAMENAAEEGVDAVGDAAQTSANAVGDAGATMANGAGAAGAMNYFNETLTAVQGVGGDLTAIPAATAVSNVDGWISRLEGVDGMGEIVEGLKELKETLTEPGGIDGREVGTVLKSLGEDTAELNNPALAPLSAALNAAGAKLGGL